MFPWPLKGRYVVLRPDILIWREISLLTDFFFYSKANWIYKPTLKDNTVSYCFTLFICGGPYQLSSSKQETIFSSELLLLPWYVRLFISVHFCSISKCEDETLHILSVPQRQLSPTAAAVWWWQAIMWAPPPGRGWCCSVWAAAWCGPETGWETDRGWSTGTCSEPTQTTPWRGCWTCSLQGTRGSTTPTTWAGSASAQQPSGTETSPWSSKVTLTVFECYVCSYCWIVLCTVWFLLKLFLYVIFKTDYLFQTIKLDLRSVF